MSGWAGAKRRPNKGRNAFTVVAAFFDAVQHQRLRITITRIGRLGPCTCRHTAGEWLTSDVRSDGRRADLAPVPTWMRCRPRGDHLGRHRFRSDIEAVQPVE